MRLLRTLAVFKIGVYVGMALAAMFAKRALRSRGDEESDELALFAIFDGIELKNRSKAFRGGSAVSWFGGTMLDLRDAQLAPDAHLSVHTLFGGVAIKIPAGWRVESDVKALAGGVDTRVVDADAADAPTLTIDGMAVFGGIAVGVPKADEPALATSES